MAVGGDPFGYYGILGVSPGAGMEEIKAAFREQAKLFHPDSGAKADAERFRSVQEAYATLRDPYRRRAYDGSAESPFTLYPALRGRRRPLFWGLAAAAVVMLVAAGAMVGRWSRTNPAITPTARDRMVQGPGSAAFRRVAASPLLHDAIAFAGDRYEADEVVRSQITGLRRDLATALGRLPANANWAVIVAGRSQDAWGADGALVASWETSLLRIGTVIDALVQGGVPAGRIGLQFAAGGEGVVPSTAAGGATPATVTVDLVVSRP